MKVKNLNGTSGKRCKCKSWYAHWNRCSNYEKKRCSNIKCSNEKPIGAHVKKYKSTDEKHYIIPLCYTCNKSTQIIDIGTTTLVWANKLQTCAAKKCTT